MQIVNLDVLQARFTLILPAGKRATTLLVTPVDPNADLPPITFSVVQNMIGDYFVVTSSSATILSWNRPISVTVGPTSVVDVTMAPTSVVDVMMAPTTQMPTSAAPTSTVIPTSTLTPRVPDSSFFISVTTNVNRAVAMSQTNGEIQILRTGSSMLSTALTVYFTLAGTAIFGTDYTLEVASDPMAISEADYLLAQAAQLRVDAATKTGSFIFVADVGQITVNVLPSLPTQQRAPAGRVDMMLTVVPNPSNANAYSVAVASSTSQVTVDVSMDIITTPPADDFPTLNPPSPSPAPTTVLPTTRAAPTTAPTQRATTTPAPTTRAVAPTQGKSGAVSVMPMIVEVAVAFVAAFSALMFL